MSNEKPSDTNETGTVYASTSGEETEYKIKTFVKRIVRCKYIHESTKEENNLQTKNVGVCFLFFLLIKYGVWSNGKEHKKL